MGEAAAAEPGQEAKKRGRPPADIRLVFVDADPPAERGRADSSTKWSSCRCCGEIVKGEAERLEHHLRQQCKALRGEKAELTPNQKIAVLASRFILQETAERTRKAMKTASLDGFVRRNSAISPANGLALAKAAAEMCYYDNRTLGLWDTTRAVRFWKLAFGDDVCQPTRYKVSGPLLDQCYEEAQKSLSQKMHDSEFAQIVADGWSDRSQKGLIAIIALLPEAHFLESFDTSGEPCTAQVVATRILACIDQKLPGKVVSLVTDSEAKMTAAWTLIRAERPNIICFGCAAHALNLALSDIFATNAFSGLIADARKLADVSKKKVWRDALEESGCSSILRDVPTRWGSAVTLTKSILANQKSLQAASFLLARRKGEMTEAEAAGLRLIQSAEAWQTMTLLARILSPVVTGIKFLEREDVRIGHLYDILSWIHTEILSLDLDRDTLLQVDELFVNRFRFLYDPVVVLAACLDPTRIASLNRTSSFRVEDNGSWSAKLPWQIWPNPRIEIWPHCSNNSMITCREEVVLCSVAWNIPFRQLLSGPKEAWWTAQPQE